MAATYSQELHAQEVFYNQFLPLIDKKLTIDDLQHDNLDGLIGNVPIEMKLNISDLNSVVFQGRGVHVETSREGHSRSRALRAHRSQWLEGMQVHRG